MVPAFARGQIKTPALEKEKIALLTINCIAQQAVIKPGETVNILATATNVLNRPLTFSYSASAGRIAATGARAVYSSEAVAPGKVEITCRVTDDQGRTATSTVGVTIAASSAIHLPGNLIKNPGITGSAIGYPAPPPPPPPPEVVRSLPLDESPPPHKTKGSHPVEQPVPVISAKTPLPQAAEDLIVKPSVSAPSDEYSAGIALQAWKKGLKEGHIHYNVPPGMTAQIESPVTVRIDGFQNAASARPLLGETGSGTLKVSEFMKVELLAPLNPGEFTITPQDKNAEKFVPIDGSATWNWVVTPAFAAKNQKLEIRVSLVHHRPNATLEDPLEDTNYTVNVDVQKLTTTMWQDFQKDPIAFIKYMAPGGAGWAALAAFITSLGGFAWWKKKRTKKAAHKAHPR